MKHDDLVEMVDRLEQARNEGLRANLLTNVTELALERDLALTALHALMGCLGDSNPPDNGEISGAAVGDLVRWLWMELRPGLHGHDGKLLKVSLITTECTVDELIQDPDGS